MFSADTPTHNHSLRPKRSRPAASNDDSIKLPQAKRKRSALRRDTFEPLNEASVNEVAGRETSQVKTNGHAIETKAPSATPGPQSKDLTIRNGKKVEKRIERGSGGLTLANNDFYTVTQLPSLPDQIRSRPNVPYTCIISPEYGYALALTHTDALIWPYNASSTTPSSRDVVTFKLPLPPASATDPLPLATFTARSVGGEPGIVVVSPKWGKVVYWDTITNASTVLPGQSSNGVQGSVPGMLSGETIQELISAEPAGFILTFSHGRVAQLAVRDQMGRPAVSIQFLRKSAATSGGGLFGSIRNVFGGDRRKGTPKVRPGSASKGQRTVVVVTADAEFELWDTTTSSGNSLISTMSFKDSLFTAISSSLQNQHPPNKLNFEVLDFEIASTRAEVARQNSTTMTPLIVLLSADINGENCYYLAELILSSSEVTLKTLRKVVCYSTPVNPSAIWKPCLIISRKRPLAFVVFESAVAIVSLAKIQESPSSQLLMEGQITPHTFQDCIYFQEDAIYRVIGCAAEDQDEHPACLLAVQGFGLIRLSSHLTEKDEVDVDDADEKIRAKTKLEQAVFYGTNKQNPLDLQSSSLDTFDAEEIQNAAQAISLEILTSTAKHLPRGGPSIDMQMKIRAKALDDLIHYLMKYVPGKVSRNTRYKLLWDAEKLAAAQAMWKVQEDIQRRYPLPDRETTYLDFTLKALHEARQKYPDAAKGEKDRVRHWLLNSVDKFQYLVSELVDCLRELEPFQITDPKVIGEYVGEALDLWTTAYTAALKFREDNAPHYGLGDDVFEDGVLLAGFPATTKHPWTSLPEPIKYSQQLTFDVCKYLEEWWYYDSNDNESKKKPLPTDEDGNQHDAPPRALLEELAARLPIQVEIFNRLVTEEIIQATTHVKAMTKDPDMCAAEVASIKAEKRPRMTSVIREIAKYNMDGAIKLAEHLKDPGLLVTLTTEYLQFLVVDSSVNPEHKNKNSAKIAKVQNHAETYYDRFGKGWAFANFSHMIEDGELGQLLVTAQSEPKKQEYLTWFMKKSAKFGQSLGKISWINDVVGEGDFKHAEETLVGVAEDEEMDLSNQRIELSLAKLTSLAALEDNDHYESEKVVDIDTSYDRLMTMADIQERISEHINAVVGPAIDAKAAEDLALQNFATRVVVKEPALRKLLKAALQGILERRPLSAEALVDLLTLIDPVEWAGEEGDDPGVLGTEFALALQVIELSSLSLEHKAALRCIVWRRAMIRDDWNILNDTRNKDDETVEASMQASALFRTIVQVLLDAQREGSLTADAKFQLASPKQILEQESVFPRVLQDRFMGDEKEKDAIRKDLEKEQKVLKGFVDKAQLEMHWSGLLASAERVVQEEMAQEVQPVEAEEGVESG